LIRTRFIVVVAAILSLALTQGASAKTGRLLHNEVAHAGVQGSMKMMTEILSSKRPTTTPLADWAKAATERARQERLTRQENRKVMLMTEEEMMFSRDRD